MMLIENFLQLFVEAAPWLLLGFAVAGLMKAWVPEDFLATHLGSPGVSSTVKAAVIGAPLPLCSCGVIPAALGLRRAGASKGATTSFLISTPETGVDSIAISYALLGPVFAVTRPIAAIVSAITAGMLVGGDEPEPATTTSTAQSNCCASEGATHQNQTHQNKSRWSALKSGISFTFIDLVKDIALWLIVGLALAAVIKTFVPTEFLAQWGSGWAAFVVMALVGVPMYICATASTPLAAGFLFAGLSPGAVLVFLLVGPATNIATIGLVAQELGRRALAAYLSAVVGVAFLFGYGLNGLADYWRLDFSLQAEHAHELLNPVVGLVSAVVLALLIANALWSKFRPTRY